MTRPGSTVPRLLLTSGRSSRERGAAAPSKTTAMPILRMRLPNRLREADEVMATVGSVGPVIVAKGSVSGMVESLWQKARPGRSGSGNSFTNNLADPGGRSTLINDTAVGQMEIGFMHRAEPPPLRKLRLGDHQARWIFERAITRTAQAVSTCTRLGRQGGSCGGCCSPGDANLQQLERTGCEGVLEYRVQDCLEGGGQPVDEDRRSHDRVAIDDDSVPGHKLIVGRRIAAAHDRGEVDGQDLLAASSRRCRTYQADVIGSGRGNQAACELNRIEDRLVPRHRQPAGRADVAENVIVLTVVCRHVHEDAVAVFGFDDDRLALFIQLGAARLGIDFDQAQNLIGQVLT